MLRACLALLILTAPALADAPKVATDIAPVHSLVARVMQGVGAPELIVAATASPHGYALRPSQARALQEADLVVWIGPALTPWLEKPLDSLAPGAEKLELLAAEGTGTLELRNAHAGTDHDHDHDAHGVDPHAWLDPQNARHWLTLIADRLAAADPDNAARYRANAAEAAEELAALQAEIAGRLAPVAAVPFVTFHDGYRYFEDRFGLTTAGAFAPSDARGPGPARLADLAQEIRRTGVRCAFTEPQFDGRLMRAVAGEDALNVAELDPIGSSLTPGPGLYPALLTKMAEAMAACLGR